MLLAPSASYTPVRCLQGKSDPEASKGELLREDFPNGVGVFMIMCELPKAASPKTAMVVDESMLILVESGRSGRECLFG